MEENEQDEVIVDDVEDTNEETEEVVEETEEQKPSKPKRTPQEELEYFEGRASRLRKKLGLEDEKSETPKKEDASKPTDLDYGKKAFLKTYGIQGSDELELVKTFQARTGDDLDTIVSDDIFLGKLNALREAKASANAVPKGKNRSGQTGVTDTDLAVAKFKETGELPSDFKTRSAVVKAIEAEEQMAGVFEGPSVVGPNR